MSENPQDANEQQAPEPGQPQDAPPPPAPAETPVAEKSDDKTFAILCHVSAIFLGWLGPLIIWLIKKDQSELVDDQGKESLNFQISIWIYGIAASLLCLTIILIPLVILFVIALGIFDLVMVIIAAVKVSNGERYRYPLCIRLIK